MLYSLSYRLVLLLLISSLLEGVESHSLQNVKYLICIDGGGSCTEMHILNKNAHSLSITKNGKTDSYLTAGPSNINTVGEEGIRQVFLELFENIEIGKQSIPLATILSEATVLGGMAGLSREDDQQTVRALLIQQGFKKENIVVMSDADLALEILADGDIVLIAGTGSICFANKNGQTLRVGGLGRLIGDEGSGYSIGIEGIKAGLEAEYGWGEATSLLDGMKKNFQVAELKEIIRPIYHGLITPAEIAATLPFIFEEAEKGDLKAQEIVNKAQDHLAQMVITMMKKNSLSKPTIYLSGGVFHNVTMSEKIQAKVNPAFPGITWVNIAQENTALLAAKKLLRVENE